MNARIPSGGLSTAAAWSSQPGHAPPRSKPPDDCSSVSVRYSTLPAVARFIRNGCLILAGLVCVGAVHAQNPLTITTSSLPDASVGMAYSNGLSASGGTGSGYTWAASGLPPGLSCDTGGSITGTPETNGVYTFSATVIDSGSDTASTNLSLNVSGSSTNSLPGYLNFNGTNYAWVANSSGQFDPSTGTYELWFRSTTAGSDTRLLASYDGTASGFLIGLLGSSLRFCMWGQDSYFLSLNQTSSVNILDGEWHHIAVTLAGSGNTVSLWLDGQLEASGTGGTASSNDGVLSFMRDPYGYYQSGDLKLVRISDSVRYSDSFTPPASYTLDSNTIALWVLNDGSGITIHDSSGNGYDATQQPDGNGNYPVWRADVPTSTIIITDGPVAANITCASANILWSVTNTTSQTAVHTVYYWLDGVQETSTNSATASIDPGSGQVSVTLTNLLASLTYDYYVESSNAVANAMAPTGSPGYNQFSTLTNGLPGYLSFNGTNYAWVANSSGQFDPSTGTYELWFRSTTAGNDTRMLATYDGSANGFLIGLLGGGLRFCMWGQDSYFLSLNQTSSVNILDGEWHHIAVTLSGANNPTKLWLDGQLEDWDAGGAVSSDNGVLSFMRDPYGYYQSGDLKLVRISDSVRYSDSFTPPRTYRADDHTIALWVMNDGNGITIHDDSSHGYTAALEPDGNGNYPAWGSNMSIAITGGPMATNIAYNSVSVLWGVTNTTRQAAVHTVYYWLDGVQETPTNCATASTDPGSGQVSVTLTNLLASLTYDYYVESSNALASAMAPMGSPGYYTFNTLLPLIAITNAATIVSLSANNATICWNVTNNTGELMTHAVYYWPSNDVGSSAVATAEFDPGNGQASVTLTNLQAGVVYNYFVLSANGLASAVGPTTGPGYDQFIFSNQLAITSVPTINNVGSNSVTISWGVLNNTGQTATNTVSYQSVSSWEPPAFTATASAEPVNGRVSVTLTNLGVGTAYSFSVHSFNEFAGISGPTGGSGFNHFTFNGKLAISSAPSAGSIGANNVSIFWNLHNGTGETTTNVVSYWADGVEETPVLQATAVTDPVNGRVSVTLTNLDAGQTYDYIVQSGNSQANASLQIYGGSDVDFHLIPSQFNTQPLLAIGDLSVANIDTNSATLSWSVSNATGMGLAHLVYYWAEDASNPCMVMDVTDIGSGLVGVTLTNLQAGQTYGCYVHSFNEVASATGPAGSPDAGHGTFTTESYVTIVGLPTVTDLTATNATVSWNVSNLLGLSALDTLSLLAPDGNGGYQLLGTSTASSADSGWIHLTVWGLLPSTAYRFTLRSAINGQMGYFDDLSLGGDNNPLSFLTLPNLLITNSPTVDNVTGDSVRINWGVLNYTDQPVTNTVYYSWINNVSSGAGHAGTITNMGSGTVSVTLEGLQPGFDYSFWVQSSFSDGSWLVSDDNGGANYNVWTLTPSLITASNAHPENVISTRGDIVWNYATFAGTNFSGVVHSVLDLEGSVLAFYEDTATNGQARFTLSNLTAGCDYAFTVQSVLKGDWSWEPWGDYPPSYTATKMAGFHTPIMYGVTVTNVTQTTADLRWTLCSTASSVEIWLNGNKLGDYGNGNHVYTITGLPQGQNCGFTLVANDGTSQDSASVTFATPDIDRTWGFVASNVTVTGAILSWISQNNTNDNLSAMLRYWLRDGGGSVSNVTMSFSPGINTPNIALSHLALYSWYRASLLYDDGYGTLVTLGDFQTALPAISITNGPTVSIAGMHSVTVNWGIRNDDNVPVTHTLWVYSTVLDEHQDYPLLGCNSTTTASSGPVSLTVSGLQPNSTYSYAVRSTVNGLENETGCRVDGGPTSFGTATFAVTDPSFSLVTDNEMLCAVLQWHVQPVSPSSQAHAVLTTNGSWLGGGSEDVTGLVSSEPIPLTVLGVSYGSQTQVVVQTTDNSDVANMPFDIALPLIEFGGPPQATPSATSAIISWQLISHGPNPASFSNAVSYRIRNHANSTAVVPNVDGSGYTTAYLTNLITNTSYSVHVQFSANLTNTWGTRGDAFVDFTTLQPALSITDLQAGVLAPDKAQVTWTAIDNTDVPTTHTLYYWEDGTDGILNPLTATMVSDHVNGQVAVSMTLTGLTVNRTYDYWVQSSNSLAKAIVPGNSFLQFSTAQVYLQIASTPTLVSQSNGHYSLNWDFQNNTSVGAYHTVAYSWTGPSGSGQNTVVVYTPPNASSVSVPIVQVNPNSTYSFSVGSTLDGYPFQTGCYATTNLTFETGNVTQSPLISIDSPPMVTVIGNTAVVTWHVEKADPTDPAFHYVIAGTNGVPSSVAGSLIAEGFAEENGIVTVVLAGLTPDIVHHYYVQSVIDSAPGHYATDDNSGACYSFKPDSWLFSGGELTDVGWFIATLVQHSDPVSSLLWTNYFSQSVKEVLTNSNATLPEKQSVLAGALNQVLLTNCIYNPQVFTNLSYRVRDLLTNTYNYPYWIPALGDPSLVWLNHLILQDVFPLYIGGIQFTNDHSVGIHALNVISTNTASMIAAFSPTTNGVTDTMAWITWNVATTSTNAEASHFVVYCPNSQFAPTNTLMASGTQDENGSVTALLLGLTPNMSYRYYVQSVVDFAEGHHATDSNGTNYYSFTTHAADNSLDDEIAAWLKAMYSFDPLDPAAAANRRMGTNPFTWDSNGDNVPDWKSVVSPPGSTNSVAPTITLYVPVEAQLIQ